MVEISSQAPEIPKNSLIIAPIEWRISDGLVPYEDALAFMEQRVAEIIAGHAPECIWLLEHPPLYTAGTSAKAEDLISAGEFPVYATGRGGQYTYHGPGQRVVYVMLNLAARGGDVRAFVQQLEDWIIATLAAFNIRGEKRCDRVGVWVQRPDKAPIYPPKSQSDLHEKGEARLVLRSLGEGGSVSVAHGGTDNKNIMEDKIAALGIRLRKGVTFHGISINIEPDLSHFKGIVPCGISQYGVTSFWDLGHTVTMEEVDVVLKQEFERIFTPHAAA